MDDIIKMVAEKVGIPQDKARSAVEVVLSQLKSRLPGGLGGQIESALSGGTGGAGGDLGSMLGGNKGTQQGDTRPTGRN